MQEGRAGMFYEVDRLLARCPKLRSNPALSSIVREGEALEEEKLVDALAGVFVHPDYTIPILGCFRRIGRKIIERVVGLLQLVPDLGSNGGIEGFDGIGFLQECQSFDNAEAASLIEFYSKRGKGLDLHELSCLAFCRALELAPFLKGCVKCYHEVAPPPFVRIVRGNYDLRSLEASRLFVLIVRISYRFLLIDPDYFSSHWDWSCFSGVIKHCEHIHPNDDAEYMNNICDIRWIGAQILSVCLKLPNRTVAGSGLRAEEALKCLLRWQEFCSDVSVEKASWCAYQEGLDFLTQPSLMLPSDLVEIDSPQSAGRSTKGDSSHFVMTSAMKRIYERLVLAVNQKWPVLLHGPSGCGKTALINMMARKSGNQVLLIHMDEQIDGRTLVGSYVCTEQPGEFRWQPGSLTQAVANGLWVVFENIDQAPSDVHSILLPLLEGRSSFTTGHGEAVHVAQSFRLFSTITSSKLDASSSSEGRITLSSLWRRILIGLPSREDLDNIVTALNPNLEPIAQTLIDIFLEVNKLYGFGGVSNPSPSSFDRFSLRDILKFCKRIAGSGLSFGNDSWTPLMCSRIYFEAVDIFASSSASARVQKSTMDTILKLLNMPVSAMVSFNKPSFQDFGSGVQIGRVTLERTGADRHFGEKPFVQLQSSLHILERVACSVRYNEPVLLVGETGTGKTTLVQSLALKLGIKLTVLNLSQQSDVSDLLGGFKPVDARSICIPLYKEFLDLFSALSLDKKYPSHVSKFERCVHERKWKQLLIKLRKVALEIKDIKTTPRVKRKRNLEKTLMFWQNMFVRLDSALRQITSSSGMMFKFVEGAFITALRKGEWILLDEVNLAPPETLSRIVGILDGEDGSLCLAERGDIDYVSRHPSFRIFACMNPANDAGKRDLPYSLRSRFTEYFVNDVLDVDDLTQFVRQFIGDINHSLPKLIGEIVRFYIAAKEESDTSLLDGANQKPQYSLRSLYRALEYTRKAMGTFGFKRSLYDGFCMFFMTSLEESSAKKMGGMIVNHLLDGKEPENTTFDRYLGIKADSISEKFVLTRSVKEHLRNIARAVLIKRYPVLLQGPTSSGKTSMVQYLAAITGHEFVRINNHEHTDLQEYLGSYIADATGKLVFQEGVLVKAVRNGHWIVLDELNLAPSDVLEALNRLLDDNRELFVPELCETIRAHPNFMLFATQNPPTFYGGRKMLSRAFRNRFVELHVDGIPEEELCAILKERCCIPESYAKKMVDVMKDLQLRRRTSEAFAGKHGFITPRDLFRWAERFRKFGKSYYDLAVDGYLLLAERLRDDAEKKDVQEVLERRLRVSLLTNDLYKQEPGALSQGFSDSPIEKIIWTKSMSRLYFLVERCYEMREPVLLVGETGAGKTTVCQLLSMMLQSKLHILNCHQYTETSDFIGGFYPVRERSKLVAEFKNLIQKLLLLKTFMLSQDDVVSDDINQAPSTLDKLNNFINSKRQSLLQCSDFSQQDLAACMEIKDSLSKLHQQWQTIFMWQDGPLVQAMKDGALFLVDEISLADDSVLERLNSVLEPERILSLAEKGGSELEMIKAHSNFFLLATMNPGGDYGKKELSPALRNRFTEIWVPPVGDTEELGTIAANKFFSPELSCKLVAPLLNFWEWFNKLQTGRALTVRDLLSWVAFVNTTERSLTPEHAFLHGAFLVLLDGLSLGTGISEDEATNLRRKCVNVLVEELQKNKPEESELDPTLCLMENYGWNDAALHRDIHGKSDMQCNNLFGMEPFYIERGDHVSDGAGFELLAPTTRRNVLRILRAMQLPKPVLLEGSPGVGKTSLIVALGNFSGHKVVRINLSEQTDLMDLLGSDLPIESDEGIQFAWSDGILLQALKEGSWVLLDELNLAPQSVLEGLNAILDHRAEVFIPELGRTFKCPPSFRVFACQNPTYQGGGRKGLPKSFLNRFTKVFVDQLNEDDYLAICTSLFPEVSRSLLSMLISFNKKLYEETMVKRRFAQDGSPWEFNLRDVIRSCQIIRDAPDELKCCCFLNVVYIQRMRTAADRREVLRLYEQVFRVKPFINPYPRVQLNDSFLVVGRTLFKRNIFHSTKILCDEQKVLPEIRSTLEATVQCVQQGWLCILVGPTSSGKTSLVRLLAQLSGNVLNEINICSATDISEMLGCFEQYNAFRNFQSAVAQVERYVKAYCNELLISLSGAPSAELKDFIARRLSFFSSVNLGKLARSVSTETEWGTSLSLMVEVIEILRSDLEMNIVCVSWSHDDLCRMLQVIKRVQVIQYGRPLPVKFEWVAGLLIRAIENGEWIVLEDANLCNPTVLDRINSLVESNGFITVNECGNVDGKPLTLQPHPNFRMFLTVNPIHGEISRAMRNRGVEIFMMQPQWMLEAERGYSVKEIELNDIERFLALSSIPNSALVNSMAKAHMHARDEGLRLSVKISYLELARWVQLFQKLLMTGNQLMESLHLSWEHIYSTSLGESEGWDIVDQAKASFLSVDECLSVGSSPVLPGGWPVPLSLRNFIWFSKEACVKQNCMYLEFLGSQYASYQYGKSERHLQKMHHFSSNCKTIYLTNMKILQSTMHPKGLDDAISNGFTDREFDERHFTKMLLFATNWILEQATEIELGLYHTWFDWYDSQLQPYCQFFGSFLALFKHELEHPIWKCILEGWRNISVKVEESDPDFEAHLKLLPMLAIKLADAKISKYMPLSDAKVMSNAIKCVELLRRTLWQWNAEYKHDYDDKARDYLPVLKSLHWLEEKILVEIVDSSSFDLYLQLYSNLLEEHISFWNCVVTSQFDYLLPHWRSLIKNSLKLEHFCPEAVKVLLEESNRPPWPLGSLKPMLWIHGGHPFIPGSAKVYHKLCQIFAFSELVWPAKRKSDKWADDNLFETAVSSNPELRFLTMEGFCMSSHVARENGEDEDGVIKQLTEIHEMLSTRFHYEKEKLKALSKSDASLTNVASCCVISPETICSKTGYNCWIENLPVIDQSSIFLDLPLLQQMPEIILADDTEVQLALSHLVGHIRLALDFSLKFSSRSPLDLLPYQKILWLLDAWASASAVDSELASSTLELWFRWHSFLWNYPPLSGKELQGDDTIRFLPCLLVTPLVTEAVQHSLGSICTLKDYFARNLQLRAASHNIWQSAMLTMDLKSFFLHSARSLLHQLIFAYRRSFSDEIFTLVKSRYPHSSMGACLIEENDIKALVSLLQSSTHRKFKSLVVLKVQPLLEELYLKCSLEGPLCHIGYSWMRLGELRFDLLLSSDNLDPTLKYSCKRAQLLEKISSLELEIKVREECNYLAGSLSSEDVNRQLSESLDSLRDELKRLEKKIVFRSDPRKFKQLETECRDFLKMVSSAMLMVNDPNNAVEDLIIDRAKSWQAAADGFIDRLSVEFSGYTDVIQPFQVAVYEMKLGLSLVISNMLEKNSLCRISEDSFISVTDTVCSYMRFPPECGFKASMEVNVVPSELPRSSIAYPTCGWAENIRISTKFVKDGIVVQPGKMVSPSLCQDILGRVVNLVANTRVMNDTTFLALDDLYADFVSIWMAMKVQEEATRSSEAQGYLFKPRAFKIEDIYDIDLSTLKGSFSSSSFAEWNEALHNGDDMETKESSEEPEALRIWNSIEEAALRNMVVTHNELFGSVNLIQNPGKVEVSDARKLASFIESYAIGAGFLRDLRGISANSLEAKLGPEHLLRLCLGNEWQLIIPNRSAHVYNFYKDSNSSALGNMVKLLKAFQSQVLHLMDKWEEHPGLQKILDIVEMLLSVPITTPLAKVLSGLQFLYGKVTMLEDEGSKFPLNDQLEPILALASSWQKMELDSWRTMLSEVRDRFEMNAAKLWFPLYSILHPSNSAEISEDDHVKSLVEFIETSSVGEFSRRLQLVLAFHGQIAAGICLKSYTSPFQLENHKIMYNLFGSYIQYLPVVEEHNTTNRKNIEKKLERHLKLCRWNDKLLPIENSRRNRQKLKKIMLEYTCNSLISRKHPLDMLEETLQQPFMLVLQQKSAECGIRTLNPSHVSDKRLDLLSAVCGLPHFSDTNRLTSHFRAACDSPDPWYKAVWFTNWQTKVDHALQKLHSERGTNPDFYIKEETFKEKAIFKTSCFSYPEGWNQVWCTLQEYYLTAIDTSEKWNFEGKNPGKMRALVGLLNLLESSGLAKHKSAFQEYIHKHSESTWWMFQPSHDVKHLLPKQDGSSGEEVDIAVAEGLQCLNPDIFEEEWRIANQYYFKSLASVRDLMNLSVNFDQEQIGKSRSFLSQMVVIAQDQREAAYDFTKCVTQLSDGISCLKNICTFVNSSSEDSGEKCLRIPNQCVSLKCMWKQKDVFDTLCGLSHGEALLLKKIENTHLSSCQSVKPEANQILNLMEMFIPQFKESKAMLDGHLLGNKRDQINFATSLRPVLVSKEMEALIIRNFEVVREFKGLLSDMSGKPNQGPVVETLLGHFDDIIKKAEEIEEEYLNKEAGYYTEGELLQYEYLLSHSIDSIFGYVMDALNGPGSRSNRVSADMSWDNITLWRTLFDSYVEDLHLNHISDELIRMVSYAARLTNMSKPCANALLSIEQFLGLIFAFCKGLLHDFLAVHKTLAIVTHKLAETFTTLFSKGYQKPGEDLEDDGGDNMTKDASGTGMGEGEGVKDVSDQITDEDQLLGTSEKKEEEDALNQLPSKNDKGIEMDEDFEADTFDVSEDSGDDNEEEDDQDELDNEMGKTGDDGEIAAEKLWDKEEDEKPNKADEKDESGPSVDDKDPSNRELRGKDDSAATADELDGKNPDKDGKDEMDLGEDGVDDVEDTDEMNAEKKDVSPDAEGLDLNEPCKSPEQDAELELNDFEDPMEEDEVEENDEHVDQMDAEELGDPAEENDEHTEDGGLNQLGETEKDDSKENDEADGTQDSSQQKSDMPSQSNSEFNNDLSRNMDAPLQAFENHQGANPSAASEMKWSAGDGNQNDFSASDAHDQVTAMLGDSKGEKLAEDQPESKAPEQDTSSLQKSQPNPHRSVGDALEGWKERVKVSTDVQNDSKDTGEELVDGDAAEYGFTSEFDKGTGQAQGPAMPDQIEQNINGDKPDEDGTAMNRDNPDDMETEHKSEDVEAQSMKSLANMRNKVEEPVEASSPKKSSEEGIPQDINHNSGSPEEPMNNIISVQKSFMSDDTNHQLSELSVGQSQQMMVENHVELETDVINNGTALWRKYELQTTRLSQELAEQLRLVMEPTLASKLQGDYRTGKRINMKKVIPYVASHYRKDKIWLRRTKPNKRDYQVVLAVDDSLSMSESGCADVAIEALVTVCRAMSQLEVGKLAVASFGKEGNIKLLHDFDQPFTGEAGIKMVSSLTFKQENTIVENPMVDLMMNLNGMLNRAAANARLPSGQNPLEQLVLIIADGRFHEKEKLKRYVRELTNQKRMVAFLLVDSSRESIMDLQEASFKDGKMKISRYLDTFPFPYYIILKNVDALPRTLADLLRQWFELMQHSRD